MRRDGKPRMACAWRCFGTFRTAGNRRNSIRRGHAALHRILTRLRSRRLIRVCSPGVDGRRGCSETTGEIAGTLATRKSKSQIRKSRHGALGEAELPGTIEVPDRRAGADRDLPRWRPGTRRPCCARSRSARALRLALSAVIKVSPWMRREARLEPLLRRAADPLK